MDDYPSNSNKRPEPKKIEKVVEGKVVRRKRTLGRKFKDFFLGMDAKSIGIFVWSHILVPGAKDILVDAGETALRQRILGESNNYGGGHRSRNRSSWDEPKHTQYTNRNRYSQNTPRDGYRDEPRNLSRRGRARHDFDEIILDSRVEADEVLDQLFALIEKYGTASVKDLYGMIDVEPEYTDDAYGWMDIQGATATRVHGGGYLLNLPKPEPID